MSDDSDYGRPRQAEICLAGTLAGQTPDIPPRYEFLEAAAEEALSPEAHANRAAFERWRLVPRPLRDVSSRDLSVELFGRDWPAPVALVGYPTVDGLDRAALSRAERRRRPPTRSDPTGRFIGRRALHRPMDARLARYPFLSAAREAVEAADADLPSLVTAGEGPVIERAAERVESAIESGTVGSAHRTPRVELLSYPVARVLVSLVNDPGLTRRYAHAEAETAAARFAADRQGTALKSVDREPLTLDALLEEFDLDDRVEPADHGFAVDVSTYLSLAEDLDGERWRLVSRELADGTVPVTEDEFDELVRVAIRDRVAEGLPLSVPGEIADALDPRVAELRSLLADHGADWAFEEVDPALFPPCIEALLDRADAAGDLPEHSRFALASFLATVGMPAQVIVDRLAAHPSLSEEAAASLVDHVADDAGGEYPPPSCATMVAYGDCVNQDALCDRIGHPLEYYRRRLDGDDPAALEAEA